MISEAICRVVVAYAIYGIVLLFSLEFSWILLIVIAGVIVTPFILYPFYIRLSSKL